MTRTIAYVMAIAPTVLTSSAQTEVILDGSFEAGAPNSAWSEYSLNFGTPICDEFWNPYEANTGEWFAWFGGMDTATEVGALSQPFTIPSSGFGAQLSFWLHIPYASPNSDSFMVFIDNQRKFLALSSDSVTYGPGYAEVSIDLDSYANGDTHMIMLWGHHLANLPNNLTNFLVDDVSLVYSDITGVVHDLLSNGLQIMPNPTSDELNVIVNSAREHVLSVELLNVSGKQVSSHSVPPGATGTLRIPVNHLVSGSYVLRISDPESTITQTVMVQH